jgi:hypothetical protein
MTDEKTIFGLASSEDGAPAPVLCVVRADGRLDGLLFDLTLRQTYRNTSQDCTGTSTASGPAAAARP